MVIESAPRMPRTRLQARERPRTPEATLFGALPTRRDGGRPLLYLEFSTIKYSLLAAERGSWEKPDWGPVGTVYRGVTVLDSTRQVYNLGNGGGPSSP